MLAMRAWARDVIRLLLAALFLQFSAPLPSLAGHLLLGELSAGRMRICLEGGIHYLHSDSAPANPPKDGGNGTNSDCCTLSCHIHGALLAIPSAVSSSSTWFQQLVVTETAGPPDPIRRPFFEARAPPRSV